MFGLFINWDSILILSFGWWHGNELDLCFFFITFGLGLFALCDLYLGLWRLLCCWAWILIKLYDLGCWSLCFGLVYLLDIKLGLILVVYLGLFIKLGLNYKILNLDLIGFILVTHLCYFFVFAWARSVNLLAEHELMTRGAWNFMEQSETRKAINGALNLL